jgi:hypothetical protein
VRGFWHAIALAGLAAGCFLATTRPGFSPLLGTPAAEVRLATDTATERLAQALRTDSIPVSRIEPRDGYLETAWFEGATGAASRSSTVGPAVVRVRGWVDPGRIGHSDLRVEVAYRAFRDLSVPERELERAAPPDHPVVLRVKAVLDSLEKRFGDPPPPPPEIPDTESVRRPPREDEGPVKDEAPVEPDSQTRHPARPDSTRRQTT